MIGVVDESRLDDFKHPLKPQPATVLSLLGLVVLNAKADIEAADGRFKAVRFDRAEIDAKTVKTVASRSFASGLIASLLQRLELTPKVLNLPLDLGGLTRALGVLLSPIGPALDVALNPVFDLLGLRFGEADIRVHGLSCPDQDNGRPVLVDDEAAPPQTPADRRPAAEACCRAGRRWPPEAMMRSMRLFSARKAARSAPVSSVPSWVRMPAGLIRWPRRQIS